MAWSTVNGRTSHPFVVTYSQLGWSAVILYRVHPSLFSVRLAVVLVALPLHSLMYCGSHSDSSACPRPAPSLPWYVVLSSPPSTSGSLLLSIARGISYPYLSPSSRMSMRRIDFPYI